MRPVMYKVMYKPAGWRKKKGTRIAASPFQIASSGGRIRTSDLRVMSPTSYQAALPRDVGPIFSSPASHKSNLLPRFVAHFLILAMCRCPAGEQQFQDPTPAQPMRNYT